MPSKLIHSVAALTLLGLPMLAAAETAEELCADLARKAPKLLESFPITIDATTSWTGLAARYDENYCQLNLEFFINAEELATQLAKMQGSDQAALTSMFQSDEVGEEVLMDFFAPAAEDTAASLIADYGTPADVKVTVTYNFDDPEIDAISIVAADTAEAK